MKKFYSLEYKKLIRKEKLNKIVDTNEKGR